MICEIEFGEWKRKFSAFPQELCLKLGDLVIFKLGEGPASSSQGGEEIAKVIKLLKSGKVSMVISRKASPEDITNYKKVKEDELKLYNLCKDKVKELDIPIKVTNVHIQFDRNLTRVNFIAEKRPDLKSLINELVKVYHGRMELHQIGVRDDARNFNSYGVCGRPLCCKTFLTEFEPVTINFIKAQKLACGASKLTGVCGRLMCCLAYEMDFYKEAEKRFPKLGDQVKTEKGEAVVTGVEFLKDLVTVQYPDAKKEKIELNKIISKPSEETK
ncbi:hypothetical protein KAW65_08295 [candidate division WOR-3 bacterium]|nr:hypothetical protein [candidate division WOR-3 bacterium]